MAWATAQRSFRTVLYPEQASWREAPNNFSDIPRQVHSLLEEGLNDSVQDVCTTEQLAHSLKNPNGSFNRQPSGTLPRKQKLRGVGWKRKEGASSARLGASARGQARPREQRRKRALCGSLERDATVNTDAPRKTGVSLGRCQMTVRELGPAGHLFLDGRRLAPMECAREDTPEATSSASSGSEEPASSAKDPEIVPPEESEAAPKKLCGYLSKFGGKGPIRGWKSRWFFYDEKKCHLYYSRTAQDANPLDSIDLSTAVFDCKVDAEEGTFEIKTPSRVITLKAATKQVMLYWLQQLQMKRWEFHNSPPAPATALPGNGPALHLELGQEEAELEEFLCPVKTPTGLVGTAAALQPVPAMPLALQNISLKHLGTEIQNTMHNIRGNKPTQGPGLGHPVEESPQSGEQPLAPDLSAPGKEPADSPKPAPKSSLPVSVPLKTKRQSNTFPFFSEGLARNRTGQEKVVALEQQVLVLTKELQSQKELVRILHKALEAAQQEKRASSSYLAAEEKDRLELVRHQVRHIAELGRRVEALEQERECLAHSASLHERQVQELQRHVQLLMDKNQAKQQVICKLSEKVTQDFTQPAGEATGPPGPADRDFLSQQEVLEHLKDDMEAYRTQNRFLNSEIHQVTKIWRKVAEKEKALLMKCAYLQARNCQVESKYLAGLRRLQEAVGLQAGSCSELLGQLIQEALQWEASAASAAGVELSPVSEYDEYGFLTVPDYEVEDLKLLAKIQALEVCSHHLLTLEAVEWPLRQRWAALAELTPSAELKQLLRAGVPREHRPRVWKWLIHLRVQHLHTPNCYQELLSRGQACEHPAARQIELDLNRTFPNNKHFTCPTSSFPDKLRRVLLAFSWQNPTIGYCQGLNRLAAIALLVLEEEESAFWCLVAIVESIMPAEYYTKTLTASQVDQRVLQDLLSEKLPRLMAHLGQHHVDVSLITFNWFLVVFADSLISDILLRVWDAFLYEGTKVVFRYALAIFKYNEEEILRLQDSLEIYQYLRFFTKTICDSRKLMNIAFNDMNPFPMKQLRQLRAAHRERLEAELRELERLKAEYLERQAARGATEPEGCASEDEGEGTSSYQQCDDKQGAWPLCLSFPVCNSVCEAHTGLEQRSARQALGAVLRSGPPICTPLPSSRAAAPPLGGEGRPPRRSAAFPGSPAAPRRQAWERGRGRLCARTGRPGSSEGLERLRRPTRLPSTCHDQGSWGCGRSHPSPHDTRRGQQDVEPGGSGSQPPPITAACARPRPAPGPGARGERASANRGETGAGPGRAAPPTAPPAGLGVAAAPRRRVGGRRAARSRSGPAAT
ncbi:TBC1 domain family member 2A [Ctenodactylus gundi]